MAGRGTRRASARRFLPVLGVALAAAAAAPAQEAPVITLDPILVTPSRLPGTLLESPGNATVIGRDEIEARLPASAVDLLRRVPGLHVDQPGGPGGVSSIYLRGADPNATLVMIDGIPVNDPTNSRGGSFDLSTVDPASIERIEVVRGPLSPVYGSNALAGAINILTREPAAEPEIAAQGALGRFDYRRAAASVRGPLGRGGYSAWAAYAEAGEPVEGSRFRGKSLTAKLDLPPSEETSLQLVSRLADSRAESFPDDSGGPRFAILRETDERDVREVTVGAALEHDFGRGLSAGLRASYYDRREDIRSPGVAPGTRDPFGIPASRSDSRFRRGELVASGRFAPSDRLRLSAGGSVDYEEGTSDGALFLGGVAVPTAFALERATYAGFAEAAFDAAPGLTLSAGLRTDVPEDFKARTSARLGAVYRVETTGTAFKLTWAEGFKLPSFFALGNPLVGNPDLVPETSESIEFGVAQGFWQDRGNLALTLFATEYRNLIDFEEGPPPRLVNRSAVTARGGEVALTLRLADGLWTEAQVSYVDAGIRGSDEELRNRPEWRGAIGARWRPSADLLLGADLIYVGATPDSSIPTGDRQLDDYVRIDLAASWTPAPGWRLFLAIDNLLDADYEEAVGFSAPGIRPRLGVEARF